MRQADPARTRRVLAVMLAAVVSALVGVAVAHAANEAWVYYAADLSPAGYFTTPNQNFRLYNEACRDGNSGLVSVQYLQNGGITADSGPKFTNCPGALVKLNADGQYQSRCKNEGTVTFVVVCQTTRPT